ncbi:MAG: 2-C-methyl-D-erythritol 4-phosphate cytidylyltransferase [Clostridia bacterium]
MHVQKKLPRCAAVVAAGGSGLRMGERDKLFLELSGLPVLVRTLRALDALPEICEIVIAARADKIDEVTRLCEEFDIKKLNRVVCGGATRADSVLAGVRAVSRGVSLVAIHDAARPLLTHEVARAAIIQAAKTGAAAPAVPVKDTIKIAHGGVVEKTPERDCLFQVQTPQVFDTGLIIGALCDAKARETHITDDLSAVEAIGIHPVLTMGDYNNIKITTPEDMVIAQAILGVMVCE